MRTHCALQAAVVSAVLTGCAMLPSRSTSYVSARITAPADARLVADDAASYLTHPLPPAQTTLVLDPPQRVQGNGMTPTFEAALRSMGYAVTELSRKPSPTAKPPKGVPLRYLVSPLDSGVLLRLQYEGVEAARFYPRAGNGALTIGAPFTVREAG
jgi:hypothetical protein